MSTRRRILTALPSVFVAAVSMLAVADAKKPAQGRVAGEAGRAKVQ